MLPIPFLPALIPAGLRLAGGNTPAPLFEPMRLRLAGGYTPAPLELLKTNKIYVAIGMETFNGVRVSPASWLRVRVAAHASAATALAWTFATQTLLRIGVAAWVPISTRSSGSDRDCCFKGELIQRRCSLQQAGAATAQHFRRYRSLDAAEARLRHNLSQIPGTGRRAKGTASSFQTNR